MTYDMHEYEKMFHLIEVLSKKRGQPKKALVDMVQLGMTYIHLLQDMPLKLKLLETLKEVCDKKIFLEVC